MNIQARKLNLIEEFIKISDLRFLEKLEAIFRDEMKTQKKTDVKPLSINEFNDMIDQAVKEKDNGQVVSHEELKKKVKSWK